MSYRSTLAWALLAVAPLLAAPPLEPAVDAVVERARAAFQVPGIAVAVVKDGKVLLAKGYGVRQAGRSEPVGPRTLFGIASNSKVFTAAALAILVDEGKLGGRENDVHHLAGGKSAPNNLHRVPHRDGDNHLNRLRKDRSAQELA